jgi:hypothetical protein
MNHADTSSNQSDLWPALPLDEWKDTYATLHMWTQIVGKIRTQLSPPLNHWWNCVLYVTPRGLTTSAIPYGSELFEMEFDFIDHHLAIRKSDGQAAVVKLVPRSVADFYNELMSTLKQIGIEVKIWTMPQEVPNPIPFEKDNEHASYDPEYANRFWRILVQSTSILNEFRARFIGKSSPVHFFWGSFDLAVTRFSGRAAPERPGADVLTRSAYSHEVMSVGLWPGGGAVTSPAFYAYSAPVPPGLAEEKIRPDPAFWSTEMSEFILMYNDVRAAASPREALLDFAQSTYEVGAKLGDWDRAELDQK